jgi:hypothetical protein
MPNPVPFIPNEPIAYIGRLLAAFLMEAVSKDIACIRLETCRDEVTVKASPKRFPRA